MTTVDTSYICPELTGKVGEVIEDLNYRLDKLGRMLKKDKSKIKALFISNYANSFFSKIACGAKDSSLEKNYNLLFYKTDEASLVKKQCVFSFQSQKVDGMIFTSSINGGGSFKELFGNSGPVILEDRLLEELHYSTIISGNYNDASKVVVYLAKNGYENIAFLPGIKGIKLNDLRSERHCSFLKKSCLDSRIDLNRIANSKLKENYKANKNLLNNSSNLTAVAEKLIINFFYLERSSSVSSSKTATSQNRYEMRYKACNI